jgi:hypothetical protein
MCFGSAAEDLLLLGGLFLLCFRLFRLLCHTFPARESRRQCLHTPLASPSERIRITTDTELRRQSRSSMVGSPPCFRAAGMILMAWTKRIPSSAALRPRILDRPPKLYVPYDLIATGTKRGTMDRVSFKMLPTTDCSRLGVFPISHTGDSVRRASQTWP